MRFYFIFHSSGLPYHALTLSHICYAACIIAHECFTLEWFCYGLLFIVFLFSIYCFFSVAVAAATGCCCYWFLLFCYCCGRFICLFLQHLLLFAPLSIILSLILSHRRVPSHAMQCQCQCVFSTLFIRFALTDLLNKSTEMHAHLSIILNNPNVLTKSLNGDVIVRSCAMASQSMWIAKSITFNILCVFTLYPMLTWN